MGVVLYAPALALNAGESERFTPPACPHSFMKGVFQSRSKCFINLELNGEKIELSFHPH